MDAGDQHGEQQLEERESGCHMATHYYYDDAVARVESEWKARGVWYRVVFCRCGGWRLFRVS